MGAELVRVGGIRAWVLLLGTAGLAAACGGGPAARSELVVRDSAGVRIVEHASLVATGSMELDPTPVVWIEGAPGVTPFDRLVDVRLLTGDAVAIVDGGAREVHAFSLAGEHLWSSGGEGDGPGEYRFPGHLVRLPGDTVAVMDGRHRRLTLLGEGGRPARMVTIDREAGALEGSWPSGELLLRRTHRAESRRPGVQEQVLTWSRARGLGAAVDSLLTTPGDALWFADTDFGRLVLAMSFMRKALAEPFADGLYFAASDAGAVDGYDLAGVLRSRWRFPLGGAPLTDEDGRRLRETALGDDAEAGPIARALEEIPLPALWPSIGGLLADDRDRLWVEEFRPDWVEVPRWYVFDASGTYLDVVEMPAGFRLERVEMGLAVGVWRDDLDVQSVRVYRVLDG